MAKSKRRKRQDQQASQQPHQNTQQMTQYEVGEPLTDPEVQRLSQQVKPKARGKRNQP